ncbi:glycosyltransferase [Thiohalobacter sp. COW1]|uniref:glycosyltransferase n=1 Tax=Thiohalobacter sp. COW1 TaxID=2795687 RepID=UPI001915A088|nr:glycosyltransferase [Thiohalobacter sp. COW1]
MKEKWLVHFSGDDWWQSNPHSRHHITFQFQKAGYNVLWINPMGLRFPSFKKKGFAKKIFNKIKSILRALIKISPGFYVYTFIFLPVFKRGLVERLNARFVDLQLRVVFRLLGIDGAVAFVTLPTFAPVVRRAKLAGRFRAVIYYYSDQYDQYREITDRKPILEWDLMLQEDADAIYCASEAIMESVDPEIRAGKTVKVIEHQVDFEHFDYKNLDDVARDIHAPVIGYFGSLTDSNDWGMIEHAAKARPDWKFVFLGNKRIALPELEALPNVEFRGFVSYQDLPREAAGFSVGIMFWKMTDWIRACSPLKLKEYLALGLPVVSVPIDEVVNKYSNYVHFASTPDEFVEAVERALQDTNREERRDYVKQFSWKAATREIMTDCGLN